MLNTHIRTSLNYLYKREKEWGGRKWNIIKSGHKKLRTKSFMKASFTFYGGYNDLWNLFCILYIIINPITINATVYLSNLSMPIGNSKSSFNFINLYFCRIVNLSRHPFSMMTVSTFVNLRVLVISPHNLSDDLVENFGNF